MAPAVTDAWRIEGGTAADVPFQRQMLLLAYNGDGSVRMTDEGPVRDPHLSRNVDG